jgi:hypothetical protein
VQNPAGQIWACYGDKRALDAVDTDNKNRCVNAVQASADEIYNAFKSKIAPSPDKYVAWTYAPTLESARSNQQVLAPLFTFLNLRRKEIKNRTLWSFKSDWWFWSTAVECQASGWWKYPITINGLTTSSAAVTTPKVWRIRVFYQSPDGSICQSEHLDGSWNGGANGSPVFKAVLFTPLAAITWDEGKEVSGRN